jgi:hypothetical protein
MRRRTSKICLLILAICVMSTSGNPRAAVSRNRLAANRLAANRLAANRLAANRLAANALSSTKLQADPANSELLTTEDGRDVYAYLISCALPEGVSIQAQIPGAADSAYCSSGTCTFQGNVGLADYWVDHKLNPQGQRWVSACVLARVNGYDTAEGISLRGAHDSLTVSSGERQLFTLQEGAFFGNVFTGDAPIDWNACLGKDKKESGFGGGGGGGGLFMRDCAFPDPAQPGKTICGFNFAGDCSRFETSPEPYSCKSVDELNGFYDDCHATPGDGHWPGSKTYREVITVYVGQ